MQVGEKIKELRVKNGLKQSELADKANISRVAIGNYERGDRQPSIEITKAIANALDITLEELLNDGEEYWKRKADIINESEISLLSFLEKLTPDEKILITGCLNHTLDYITRMDDQPRIESLGRLGQIISSYGEMILKSWELRANSLERPYEYRVFIKHYNKCINLIDEQKKSLLESMLKKMEFSKEQNNLLELILFDDSNEVLNNSKKDEHNN